MAHAMPQVLEARIWSVIIHSKYLQADYRIGGLHSTYTVKPQIFLQYYFQIFPEEILYLTQKIPLKKLADAHIFIQRAPGEVFPAE
jgi:hypothetical protein